MHRFGWFVALVGFLIPACHADTPAATDTPTATAAPALTDAQAQIVGTWKLLSFEAEIKATGKKEPLFGGNPTGFAIFTADGQAAFLLTGDGRKVPKTDEDRVQLLNSMIAYTGKYRLEGDKWITAVEVAWSPAFVNTEQMRFFKIKDGRLQVLTTWGIQPNWPEKGIQRRIVTFERAK
jgi:hypothetical protein